MATQFGRKAVARPVGGAPAPAPASDLAAKRAAFLAAERARREAEGEAPPEATASYVPAGPFYERDKSMVVAYALWFLLGGLSAHRFYLGYATSGAVQLCMLVGGIVLILGGGSAVDAATAWIAVGMILASTVWILFDVFLIPGMVRRGSAGRPAEAARIFA
jgi:TM2 domain-containing membrane protein YozV